MSYSKYILMIIAVGSLLASSGLAMRQKMAPNKPPNIVYVLTDQWRAQATGYAGDPNLKGKTPNLDKLASEGINFVNAVSTCPVCTPYRASMLTGRYPLTTGMFLNDLSLPAEELTIAEVYREEGYDTGYIGKWHLDGHGRDSYIPPERRQGFDYWKVLECTHKYNKSSYYAGDDPVKKEWGGYDAIIQTADAEEYIKNHAVGEKPFCLFLSWGPPHNPYDSAPQKFKDMFVVDEIKTRPNGGSKKDLAGYYAHIAAMDESLGRLMNTIDATGIRNNTILVFTSDHGDMLGSQGQVRKQKPWDESIRVPFLLRYPRAHGKNGRKIDMPIGTPDIMPTLLGLSGINIPKTVEGSDFSELIQGGKEPNDRAVMIQCPSPFGEWSGGKAYRGVRTKRYTYVRDLNGPWLMYDNEKDPYQMQNLVGNPEHVDLQRDLEEKLKAKLLETGDEFLPGSHYVKEQGYKVNNGGTISYKGQHKAQSPRK